MAWRETELLDNAGDILSQDVDSVGTRHFRLRRLTKAAQIDRDDAVAFSENRDLLEP